MLIIKHGYQGNCQVVDSGIFSKLKDFLSKFISEKQAVDMALNIARSAGQKAGQKAIEFASSKLTPKSQQILSKLFALQGTSQAPTTPNLNNSIAGSEQPRGPRDPLRAIKIEDLVRRLHKYCIL